VRRLVVLRITEKKDLMRSIAYITWPDWCSVLAASGSFITPIRRGADFLSQCPVGRGSAGVGLCGGLEMNRKHHRPSTGRFRIAGTSCIAFMYGLELMGRQSSQWSTVACSGIQCARGLGGVRHMQGRCIPDQLACLRIHTFSVAIWGAPYSVPHYGFAVSAAPPFQWHSG